MCRSLPVFVYVVYVYVSDMHVCVMSIPGSQPNLVTPAVGTLLGISRGSLRPGCVGPALRDDGRMTCCVRVLLVCVVGLLVGRGWPCICMPI